MRPLARTKSHLTPQPRFAALPLLILFSAAACTLGCVGGTGGASAASALVPPPPPPPPPSAVTVTITLATASVPLGNTQTFAATVTGATDTNVSWSVNAIAGGTPLTGTITAAGVYASSTHTKARHPEARRPSDGPKDLNRKYSHNLKWERV